MVKTVYILVDLSPLNFEPLKAVNFAEKNG